MKKKKIIVASLVLFGWLNAAYGQNREEMETASYASATENLTRQVRESVEELNELRRKVADEQLPLARQLHELEVELIEARREFEDRTRALDARTLGLSQLDKDNQTRDEEIDYLTTLFIDYVREFDARLHIVEKQRYREQLEEARLAGENTSLSDRELFDIQLQVLDLSIARLFEVLGGTRFEGQAVSQAGGLVDHGTFLLMGPTALFRSRDGKNVGIAEERLNSQEPAQIGFASLEDKQFADDLVASGTGFFPLDPTLGDAHKIESIESETFLEHVQNGGPVMIPIFALAAMALLVALAKWLGMLFLRNPSRKKMKGLFDALGQRDEELVKKRSQEIRGPLGAMLAAGVEHIRQPRELIEEVMYETVLATRLKLQRMLPFIAICAASAPLLGLLGTVTGIISTFKQITLFGSSDVRALSGGISEALITTKFGLIVAIPALLLHAFLSRKARGVVTRMEMAAVSFLNRVSKRSSIRGLGGQGEGERMSVSSDAIDTKMREIVDRLHRSLVADDRHTDDSRRPLGSSEVVFAESSPAGEVVREPSS